MEQTIGLPNEWSNWEQLDKRSFIYRVMRGRQGAFVGLSNGLKEINKYIHGTQRGKYYLIGGSSGHGKTTVGDYMYPLNAWLDAKAKGRKIKIFYLSFEVSKQDKEARWCSYFIYLATGLSIPVDYLLGRIEGNHLTEDELLIVAEAWKHTQEFLQDVSILDTSVGPTMIYETMITYYKKSDMGTLKFRPTEAEKKEGKRGRLVGYTDTTEAFQTTDVFLIIDHLKLVATEDGLDMKQTMDRISRYCVDLKNVFETTCIVYQQFNTDLLASRRALILKAGGKEGAVSLVPNKKDFSDSTASYEDADYVFGLVLPADYDVDEFFKYKCGPEDFGRLFVMMFLMKNKVSGSAGIFCPLFINPVSGVLTDLPRAENLFEIESWVKQAQDLRSELERFVPVHKTE